jgi:hypothetical protein
MASSVLSPFDVLRAQYSSSKLTDTHHVKITTHVEAEPLKQSKLSELSEISENPVPDKDSEKCCEETTDPEETEFSDVIRKGEPLLGVDEEAGSRWMHGIDRSDESEAQRSTFDVCDDSDAVPQQRYAWMECAPRRGRIPYQVDDDHNSSRKRARSPTPQPTFQMPQDKPRTPTTQLADVVREHQTELMNAVSQSTACSSSNSNTAGDVLESSVVPRDQLTVAPMPLPPTYASKAYEMAVALAMPTVSKEQICYSEMIAFTMVMPPLMSTKLENDESHMPRWTRMGLCKQCYGTTCENARTLDACPIFKREPLKNRCNCEFEPLCLKCACRNIARHWVNNQRQGRCTDPDNPCLLPCPRCGLQFCPYSLRRVAENNPNDLQSTAWWLMGDLVKGLPGGVTRMIDCFVPPCDDKEAGNGPVEWTVDPLAIQKKERKRRRKDGNSKHDDDDYPCSSLEFSLEF